jgi:hypothetical protein
MDIRGTSTFELALLASLGLALSSCALERVESPPVAADCNAADPLHRVSISETKHAVDPAIESVLTQPASDPRLMQINRQMYQSLLALDVELHRERTMVSCNPSLPESSILEAHGTGQKSSTQQTAFVAPAVASGSGNQGTPFRKGSVSPSGAAGNGATAPKIVPGSDNDIIARRLRAAAEQEADPDLRAKLWKEYRDYQQGTAAAN